MANSQHFSLLYSYGGQNDEQREQHTINPHCLVLKSVYAQYITVLLI